MKKCNWCGKKYDAGLFSNGFCSKKCEIEAGEKGVKRTIPTAVYFIFIFLALISTCISIRNSKDNEVKSKESIHDNYKAPKDKKEVADSIINYSSENSNENKTSDLKNNNDSDSTTKSSIDNPNDQD